MRRIIILVLGLVIHTNIFAQINSATFIKALKKIPDQKKFTDMIRTIGTPDSVMKQYTSILTHDDQHVSLYSNKYLKRAETFKVNLDTDTNSEFVTQLIFVNNENPQCHDRFDASGEAVFHIYVNDDTSNSNKLLSFHHFNEIMLSGSNPVTFEFEPTTDGQSRIIFTIDHTESCGVWEYAAFKHKDTLSLKNGSLKYVSGAPYDQQEENFRSVIEDE